MTKTPLMKNKERNGRDRRRKTHGVIDVDIDAAVL